MRPPKLTHDNLFTIALALEESMRNQMWGEHGQKSCKTILGKIKKALHMPLDRPVGGQTSEEDRLTAPERKALSNQFISKFGRWASIIQARVQETEGRYNGAREHGSFENALWDLTRSESSWWDESHQLFDLSNWNWQKLRTEHGGIRKPRITLEAHVTSKGNLVLEWLPRTEAVEDQFEHQQPHTSFNVAEHYDFLRFSSIVPFGPPPENRLLIIHGFEHIGFEKDDNGKSQEVFKPSDQLLIEACKRIVSDVVDNLARMFDVVIRTNLYFKYDSDDHRDHRLLDWEIRRVKDMKVEEAATAKAKWLKETFEQIGVTADEFLRIFEDSARYYGATEKALKAKNVKLTRYRIKTIIHKLFEDHLKLYETYCSAPPTERGPVPPSDNTPTEDK